MFDLETIKGKGAKCLRCNKRLCECPERQIDGTWKELDWKAEVLALKEKVAILENKAG